MPEDALREPGTRLISSAQLRIAISSIEPDRQETRQVDWFGPVVNKADRRRCLDVFRHGAGRQGNQRHLVKRCIRTHHTEHFEPVEVRQLKVDEDRVGHSAEQVRSVSEGPDWACDQ